MKKVYIAHIPGTKIYKIGVSKNPKSRVTKLRKELIEQSKYSDLKLIAQSPEWSSDKAFTYESKLKQQGKTSDVPHSIAGSTEYLLFDSTPTISMGAPEIPVEGTIEDLVPMCFEEVHYAFGIPKQLVDIRCYFNTKEGDVYFDMWDVAEGLLDYKDGRNTVKKFLKRRDFPSIDSRYSHLGAVALFVSRSDAYPKRAWLQALVEEIFTGLGPAYLFYQETLAKTGQPPTREATQAWVESSYGHSN